MAGVSEATVSRVFNGIGPMKEETRRKVLEAARRLDYQPNAIARSFALRKSGNLGVILPFVPKVHMFSTFYFSEILSGIGQQAKESGYDILLLLREANENPDYSLFYKKGKIDGCLILGSRDTPQERRALRELHANGMPFCLVNQRFDGEPFHYVEADHGAGSYAAVKHLLEQGCRRIAFLNGPGAYSNSTDRLNGYKKALADYGVAFRQEVVFQGNYSRKSGYEACGKMKGYLDRLDAVFVANDRMANGLIQGLKEIGVDVGRKLAVVGYDDSEDAAFCDPPLTSVHVPLFEMGKTAAAQLIGTLDGNHADEGDWQNKLPTRLIVRKSSGII